MGHLSDRLRQVANVLFVPAGIALNYFDRGRDVGVVTRVNEPLLSAAGWTFAIWGLLFAGQIAYAIFQAMPGQSRRRIHRRIGWFAAANGLFEGAWTFAFTHAWFGTAWVLLLASLANLLAMSFFLREDARHGREYLFVRLPFALNLGWLTVATLLGTAHFLNQSVGFDASPYAFTLVLVSFAAVASLAMIFVRHETAFVVPVAWGLLGVAAYREASFPTVAIVAAGTAIVILAVATGHAILRATHAGNLRASRPMIPTARS